MAAAVSNEQKCTFSFFLRADKTLLEGAFRIEKLLIELKDYLFSLSVVIPDKFEYSLTFLKLKPAMLGEVVPNGEILHQCRLPICLVKIAQVTAIIVVGDKRKEVAFPMISAREKLQDKGEYHYCFIAVNSTLSGAVERPKEYRAALSYTLRATPDADECKESRTMKEREELKATVSSLLKVNEFTILRLDDKTLMVFVKLGKKELQVAEGEISYDEALQRYRQKYQFVDHFKSEGRL